MMGVLDWFASKVQTPPEGYDDQVSPDSYQDPENYGKGISRGGRNLVAGAAALPLEPIKLGLLAAQVGNTVARRYSGDLPPDETVLQSFADAPLDASVSQEDMNARYKAEITAGKSPEEARKSVEDSLKSPVRRFVEHTEDSIRQGVGAPTGDDKDVADDISTVVGSSLVPSPFTRLAAIASKAGGAGKVAGKVLSATGHLSPSVHNPASVGGLANTAAGVGLVGTMDGVIEQITDVPTNDHTDEYHRDLVADNDLPDPPMPDVAAQDDGNAREISRFAEANGTTVAATIAILGMAIGSKAGRTAVEDIGRAAGRVDSSVAGKLDLAAESARSAGKTFVDATRGIEPPSETTSLAGIGGEAVRRTRDAFDELGPIDRAMSDAGMAYKDRVRTLNEATIDHRSNVSEKVDLFRSTGLMEGVDSATVPIDVFQRVKQQLINTPTQAADGTASNMWKEAELVRVARTQLDTRLAQMVDAENALAKAQVEFSTDPTSANSRAYNTALERVTSLSKDDPLTRQGMGQYSSEDLAELVAQGQKNPAIKNYLELHDKHTNDVLEMMVKNDVMSAEDFAFYKQRNPNYSPQITDPNQGATGKERWLNIFARRHNLKDTNENPVGDPNFTRQSFDAVGARQEIGGASQFMDGVDALAIDGERKIRFVSHQLFKRNLVDNILAQVNGENVLRVRKWPGQSDRTLLRTDEIAAIRAKNDKAFDDLIAVNRGGRYEFYEASDPRVKIALDQNAAASVPILRDINKWFRQATTGSLRPGFAPKNFLMDTSMMAFNRGTQSVYGLDYLAMKAMSAMGVPANAASEAVLKGARVIDGWSLNSVPYLLNLNRTIGTWFDQHALELGQRVSNQLMADQGVFAGLAKMPGGEPLVRRMAQMSIDSYKDGLYAALFKDNVASLEAGRGITDAIRSFDKYVDLDISPVARLGLTPMHAALGEYKMMLSSIHNAARIGYAMRNAEYLKWKYPDGVPSNVMRTMMSDARTLAADFSRLPGSRFLQAYSSISPYNNVMLRSVQSTFQRIASDPMGTGAFVLSGVAMPQLFSSWWFSNMAGKEGSDWYWHNQPQWQRVSQFTLPTAQLLWRVMQGERPKFDIKDYYKISLAQEFLPIASVVSSSVRALGGALHNQMGINDIAGVSLGMNQNDKLNGSTIKNGLSDFGEAMGAAFGMNLPGPIQAGLGLAGTKIELGNMFRGKSPVDITGAKMAERPGGENLNVNSSFPRGFGAAMNALFGATGLVMTEALDTGVQNYKGEDPYDKIKNALVAGGKEFGERFGWDNSVTMPVISELAPNAPILGRGMDKVYRQTPVDEHVAETRKVFGMFGGPTPKVALPTGDQLVDGIGNTLKALSKGHPMISFYNKQYKEYSQQLTQNTGDKNLDYFDRTEKRNRILLQIRSVTQSQSAMYDKIQKDIAKSELGAAYKERTGEAFTFKGFAELVPKAARSGVASGASTPRRYTQQVQ